MGLAGIVVTLALKKSGPFSRVFAYDGITHPMLKDIDPDGLCAGMVFRNSGGSQRLKEWL